MSNLNHHHRVSHMDSVSHSSKLSNMVVVLETKDMCHVCMYVWHMFICMYLYIHLGLL